MRIWNQNRQVSKRDHRITHFWAILWAKLWQVIESPIFEWSWHKRVKTFSKSDLAGTIFLFNQQTDTLILSFYGTPSNDQASILYSHIGLIACIHLKFKISKSPLAHTQPVTPSQLIRTSNSIKLIAPKYICTGSINVGIYVSWVAEWASL
jgi:hypothetical protein